ncbi:Probable E3 ubiquitin-protein ligase XERICO [Linum grandiflorum]
MGLSSFPTPSGGILPLLVMNTVISVALLKNVLTSLLQLVFMASSSSPSITNQDHDSELQTSRRRSISNTQFRLLSSEAFEKGNNGGTKTECCCCVCLCGFEDDEEVSELSCKHFFHKGCLQKWFDNRHVTCPLCRSMM